MDTMDAFASSGRLGGGQSHYISRCAFVACVYVGSLYVIPSEIRTLPRDEPRHIKARMTAVSVSTIMSAVVIHYTTQGLVDRSLWSTMGFSTGLAESVESIFITIALMSIFYLGPLIVQIFYVYLNVAYELPSFEVPKRELTGVLETLADIRKRTLDRYDFSYIKLCRDVVFAPISEEIAFRSLLINVMFANICGENIDPNSCTKSLAFHCSLWFGLAHAHHCYTKVQGGMSLKSAMMQFLVQFTYTSIFGCIAVILFVRTGSVIAPIISHMFCNFQGLPDVSFMTNSAALPPGFYPGQFANPTFFKYRYFLLFLHGLGLVLFGLCIFPMTESYSRSSLYWQKN